MTDEYIECPYCFEKIKKGALKCRYCRTYLNEQKADKSPIPQTDTVAENNKPDIVNIINPTTVTDEGATFTSRPKHIIKALIILVPIILISIAVFYVFNTLNRGSTSNRSFSVDKGLLDVSITLPATFFEGDELDDIYSEAKQKGIKDIVVNRDGSVTYTMSRSTHNRIVKDLKEGFVEALEDMKTSDDLKSIHDIKYDNNLTRFTLIVDKEAFENSFDGFAIFGIGLMSMYYQIFNGVDVNKWGATIEMKDVSSGKVFNTVQYPGDLESYDD